MQRGKDNGHGLGTQLVGEKLNINGRGVTVQKLLGEGGFSYVYLVREHNDGMPVQPVSNDPAVRSAQASNFNVVKVTSIQSRQAREIAEKEAKLLSRLSHPSIIKMHDACYRTGISPGAGGISLLGKDKDGIDSKQKLSAQHMIYMEYCEGGTALDVCNNLKAQGKRFDVPSLIIAFGQICNAVSYLHAQRPPIVHRDLKPVNFLVKNGAYKLCDFGSAVFGHVELKTPAQRSEAEEVVLRTTTQMFRAPEMVDLYMTKKLTQSTDVWALGCCLHSFAFLQNCFEEGSNLAILSRNYKIPEDNPYGEGIAELIDHMLTVDCKERADMTEVILCLSAIYSGRPLPPRKAVIKSKKNEPEVGGEANEQADKPQRVGTYRTDGQGIKQIKVVEPKRPVEAKKLNPNSAAARRRRAAESGAPSPRESKNNPPAEPDFMDSFQSFPVSKKAVPKDAVIEDLAFSTSKNPFAAGGVAPEDEKKNESDDGVFVSFNEPHTSTGEDFVAFDDNKFWPESDKAEEIPVQGRRSNKKWNGQSHVR